MLRDQNQILFQMNGKKVHAQCREVKQHKDKRDVHFCSSSVLFPYYESFFLRFHKHQVSEIGRASCRERMSIYGSAGTTTKTKTAETMISQYKTKATHE